MIFSWSPRALSSCGEGLLKAASISFISLYSAVPLASRKCEVATKAGAKWGLRQRLRTQRARSGDDSGA